MKRTCIVMLQLLVIITGRAQNIGIGTTQPDNSAALDISSSNKGLLIPRVDLANGIGTPATGLMVFNTNAGYSGGTGLYINTGTTAAPQWVQLVANTSGSFIRNNIGQQANSDFNISGTGIVGTALKVGGSSSTPLTVTSNVTSNTSIYLSNTTTPYANWRLLTSGNA
ncbi:MAG: hypothetical protein JST39_25380, partial [Bacteroidetes bacterium]|nr:hypothetical protein [Bacteroidota bacterium]